jgi:hypothetical protein
MPGQKTNGFPIALDSAFNRIVRYQVAASRGEKTHVIDLLPLIISDGLDAELDVCKEAHRYDLDGKRAYFFQLEGDCLHVWIWSEVESYVEAANLLTQIVSLEKEITEEIANEMYLRATGRNVNLPQENSPGQRWDD